ncbi:hypothetical protein MMC11_004919 [Xylographa trunciseda]|nr:hypothetical protein [Xylographa trunciseda]
MDNTTENENDRGEIPLATPPAVVESPPPAAEQPASTDNAGIDPEVIQFLNQFFLAMQIPAPESTEDHMRLFRHNQRVMLDWLRRANAIRRQLESHTEVTMLMARSVERDTRDLRIREFLSRGRRFQRAPNATVSTPVAEIAFAQVTEERVGGRLRRAGQAFFDVFRRSRRQVEEVEEEDARAVERGDEILRGFLPQ